MAKKLSIIIPIYNEEATIEKTLRRVVTQQIAGWEKEIIIVDDGSTDNSKTIVENYKPGTEKLKFFSHEKNCGKGAAIRTAIPYTTGDYCIIQDGDLEYSPREYPRLIHEMETSGAPIIYGSRELNPDRRGYPHYVLGVTILTWVLNNLYGTHLTDIYTCYKLMPAAFLKSLSLQSNGFEIEAELTAQFLKQGFHIREIPIDYHPRAFTEGKKIKAIDGLIGIWTIIKN